MSEQKKIAILIDRATGRHIDAYGNTVNRDSELLRLIFDEELVLCCNFVDVVRTEEEGALLQPCVLELGDAQLSIFGDRDYNRSTPLMFITQSDPSDELNGGVNVPGDWLGEESADMSQGQLSFRIKTNTSRFTEAIGAANYRVCELVVSAMEAGTTSKVVLAKFSFRAENRVVADDDSIPLENPTLYYTKNELDAILRAGMVVQYSLNGSGNWHSAQTGNDRYFRLRNRNMNIQWSDPVKIIHSVTERDYTGKDTVLSEAYSTYHSTHTNQSQTWFARNLNTIETMEEEAVVYHHEDQGKFRFRYGGKYFIQWSVPAHKVNSHVSRLVIKRNGGGSETYYLGTIERADGANVNTRSFGQAFVQCNAEDVLYLHHYCAESNIYGCGYGFTSFGAFLNGNRTIFSYMTIRRIGD